MMRPGTAEDWVLAGEIAWGTLLPGGPARPGLTLVQMGADGLMSDWEVSVVGLCRWLARWRPLQYTLCGSDMSLWRGAEAVLAHTAGLPVIAVDDQDIWMDWGDGDVENSHTETLLLVAARALRDPKAIVLLDDVDNMRTAECHQFSRADLSAQVAGFAACHPGPVVVVTGFRDEGTEGIEAWLAYCNVHAIVTAAREDSPVRIQVRRRSSLTDTWAEFAEAMVKP